jgi:hypothetical protein
MALSVRVYQGLGVSVRGVQLEGYCGHAGSPSRCTLGDAVNQLLLVPSRHPFRVTAGITIFCDCAYSGACSSRVAMHQPHTD